MKPQVTLELGANSGTQKRNEGPSCCGQLADRCRFTSSDARSLDGEKVAGILPMGSTKMPVPLRRIPLVVEVGRVCTCALGSSPCVCRYLDPPPSAMVGVSRRVSVRVAGNNDLSALMASSKMKQTRRSGSQLRRLCGRNSLPV